MASWERALRTASSPLDERQQQRVDHLGVGPVEVMRALLHRDDLDVADQVREPRRGRLVGQDPVLGAVDDEHRDVDLRHVVAEVCERGVHSGLAGIRRAHAGDVEAGLPGLLAARLGASFTALTGATYDIDGGQRLTPS